MLVNNPEITVDFSDSAIGVDRSSLHVKLDETELSKSCQFSAASAICTPESSLPEGPATISATIADFNGNVSFPAAVSFNVDTLPPQIVLSSPPDGYATNHAELIVEGSLNEPAALTIHGNAAVLDGAYRFSVPVTLQEGVNSLELVATDRAGHTSREYRIVTLDTQVPSPIAVGRIAVGAIVDGQVTLTGAPGSAEPGAQVVITNTRTSETVIVPVQADGAFSASLAAGTGDGFVVIVRNAAGNQSAVANIGNTAGSLQLEITTPASGAHLVHDRVTVRGTLTGPANSGVTVNGVVAAIGPDGSFVATDLALTPGDNTLTAIATDFEGHSVTLRIPVTSDAIHPVLTLTASETTGLAPLSIQFDYGYTEKLAIAALWADFDGDGTADFEGTSTGPLPYVYPHPGVYTAKLRLTDDSGAVREAETVITVLDPSAVDTLLQTLWNGMNTALIAGNLDTALGYLSGSAGKRYRPVLEHLLPHMPEIVASYSALQKLAISSTLGEYGVSREINGQSEVFLVYFLRDARGVWRIDAM